MDNTLIDRCLRFPLLFFVIATVAIFGGLLTALFANITDVILKAMVADLLLGVGFYIWFALWRGRRKKKQQLVDDDDPNPALTVSICVAISLATVGVIFYPGARAKQQTHRETLPSVVVNSTAQAATGSASRGGAPYRPRPTPVPGPPILTKTKIAAAIGAGPVALTQDIASAIGIAPREISEGDAMLWARVGGKTVSPALGSDFDRVSAAPGLVRFASLADLRTAVAAGDKIEMNGLMIRKCAAAADAVSRACEPQPQMNGRRTARKLFIDSNNDVWIGLE